MEKVILILLACTFFGLYMYSDSQRTKLADELDSVKMKLHGQAIIFEDLEKERIKCGKDLIEKTERVQYLEANTIYTKCLDPKDVLALLCQTSMLIKEAQEIMKPKPSNL